MMKDERREKKRGLMGEVGWLARGIALQEEQ